MAPCTPSSRRMVECHGSQCGFCTPGFVMALFALYHAERTPSRRRILDVLAGNLCRCTGYRPIIDAARRMYELGERDHFSEREAETVAQLKALADDDRLAFAHSGKRYFAPRRLDDLAALCEQFPGATLLAGGTDVGLWVTKQHRDLDTLIYVGAVEELQRLEVTDTHLEIGAAVTYTDAMDALGGALARLRRADPPSRLGPDQELRDDRRQRRERLADRRLHAGADRARGRAGAAQGCGAPRRCRSRTSISATARPRLRRASFSS